MHYVLDSGFFVDSRVYYPGTFPSFWNKMNAAASQGAISSVKEVWNELERYQGHQGHLLDWMNNYRRIFTAPSVAEQTGFWKFWLSRNSRVWSTANIYSKGPPRRILL